MMFRFCFLSVIIFLFVQESFAQNTPHMRSSFDDNAEEEPQRNYLSGGGVGIVGLYFYELQDTLYCQRFVNDSDKVEPYIYVRGREREDTLYIYPDFVSVRVSKNKVANPTYCTDNNKVYACWFSGKDIMFQRSTDEGVTFLPEEKLLVNTTLGSEYTVDSVRFKNSPIILCDRSFNYIDDIQSNFKHRIYICWTDAKYSPKDKDVFLMYSNDSGETWTEPILVSYRPNHKAQFDAGMEIDYRGFLYLHYYDKQNYANGKSTDVTLAVSKNGGLKFDYYRINNEEPFQLKKNHVHYTNYNLELYCYSYDDNGSYHCGAELLTDSIYASYNKDFTERENFLQIPKTISFSKKIILPIELQDTTTITAVITKPLDPYFEKRVFTEKKFNKGKNEIVLDTKKLGLEKGNYTLFLYYNSHNKFVWIVDE